MQPTGNYEADLEYILKQYQGKFFPKTRVAGPTLTKTAGKCWQKLSKSAVMDISFLIQVTTKLKMKFAQLTFAGILALALAGCDKTAQTPPVTTQLKAREPVIALALGGGGAKGFAHIGVIKVLESHGIKPRIVTGTSAGSFVGSIYASGKTPYQLQQLALQLKEADIRDLTLNSQGIILGQKLQNYVNTQVSNKPIEKFPIRFAAVATRLDNGQKQTSLKGMRDRLYGPHAVSRMYSCRQLLVKPNILMVDW